MRQNDKNVSIALDTLIQTVSKQECR